MRTVLVGPELEESLALRYLAGALGQAGHTCEVVPFNDHSGSRTALRRVLAARPGLVGLSLVAQRRYPDFRDLVANLRTGGYRGHITAGGHFASLRAPEILRDTPGIDSVLHHDGERRIVGLAELLSAAGGLPGDLDGVSWRDPAGEVLHRPAVRVADLEQLPLPTRRRPDRSLGLAKAPLVTSRGCAGSCSFCSIHAWHRQVPTGRLRYRSPESVAAEMAALHREHGVRVFVFHDDDFIHPDRRRALPRCRAILDRAREAVGEPFAFVIKCRPDDVDQELFGYLKSRGLARAYVGIETHAQSGIAALNRRVTPATNVRALSILRGLDVYACFNLLLFHPDSTLEEVRENLDFLAGHLAHPFDVARTELYARSALEDRMVAAGRALGDFRGYDYRISDPRAERAFQLFADVLWERHFEADPILHRVQDLGLRHSLLGSLHPEMASGDLAARVGALVRDTNADTVEFLRRCADLAAAGSAVPAALRADMRREVRARGRQHTARWAALSLELESRALLARRGLGRSRRAVRLPRMVSRLALALPSAALALSCFPFREVVCDPAPPPQVKFSTGIEPLLIDQCGTDECHSVGNAAEGLSFSPDSSYAHLVGRHSNQVPRLDLVKPGSPDSSYVIAKLEGRQRSVGGTGDPMPPNGEPASTLMSNLWHWISQGARKN